MSYLRANTDWLANCRYGIGVHWTAQTTPRCGEPLPFQTAVEAFDLTAFTDAVIDSGAEYLIFTSAHALQKLPAPNPVIDEILPGRTCQRDLIEEIAERLIAHGIHLILYYNHSCNGAEDPDWEKALGYHHSSKERLATNLRNIVAYMGQHYGDKLKAWWFDSPYSMDPSGPYSSVTTDMAGFQFPWERFTVAAKTGFPDRLVTYNPGIDSKYLYTDHQDYWAGEMVDLNHPPKSRFLENGLQWHGWTCLDDRAWVHSTIDAEIPDVLYSDEEVIQFVRTCILHQCPMCFNVGIYQDGTISPYAMRQLVELKSNLPGR